jgi:hypothetical protein
MCERAVVAVDFFKNYFSSNSINKMLIYYFFGNNWSFRSLFLEAEEKAC